MSVRRPKLLGLSGSLRRASFNTAILQTLAQAAAAKTELTLFPLNEIPLYNGDLEGPDVPPVVTRLKSTIAASDGIIIASPEYNYGMPGVLKNALDWASRPAFESPLKSKPVLLITSSPGALGGVRAQAQLQETFSATLSRVVARPQVIITSVKEKVVDGRLVDAAALQFALEAIEDLLSEISLLRCVA